MKQRTRDPGYDVEDAVNTANALHKTLMEKGLPISQEGEGRVDPAQEGEDVRATRDSGYAAVIRGLPRPAGGRARLFAPFASEQSAPGAQALG